MTILPWILIGFGSLMYIEGGCFAAAVGAILKPAKWVWALLVLFWPLALPLLIFKLIKKYQSMIQEFQQNPLLGAMLGMGQMQTSQSPVMAILGQNPSQAAPNPFDFLNHLSQEDLENVISPSVVADVPTEDAENKGEQPQ